MGELFVVVCCCGRCCLSYVCVVFCVVVEFMFWGVVCVACFLCEFFVVGVVF